MENLDRYKVQIKNMVLEKELRYKETVVLNYKIEYPQFASKKFEMPVGKINRYYKAKALPIQQDYNTRLYRMAIKNYEYTQQNGFPFHSYQAVVAYEVTYNRGCSVSLYFDRYEYTGGAHGNTVRSSDTWDLQSGRRMVLGQLFGHRSRYRAYIILTILHQIETQIASGDNPYFKDYKKNVVKYFNPNSFYLTDRGVVIYYQQYEIAPYAAGIQEFTIPYSEDKARRPACREEAAESAPKTMKP